MKTATQHPLVSAYLREVKKRSLSLTRSEQEDLLQDLREHFNASLTGSESEEEIREVIAAVGSPEEVAPSGPAKPSLTSLFGLVAGWLALATLLWPNFGEPDYGLPAAAVGLVALVSNAWVIRDRSDIGASRKRAFIGVVVSLITLASVVVIRSVFLPDPSGAIQVNAATPSQRPLPNYAIGKQCTKDDLQIKLKTLPLEGKLSESALLMLGNTSSSVCSIEGDFALYVGQADGQVAEVFSQECWKVPLQERCISATLKANADFKEELELLTGYATFWLTGTNASDGRACAKSTAPKYFRLLGPGIDLKLTNDGEAIATCSGSVQAEVRQAFVPTQ